MNKPLTVTYLRTVIQTTLRPLTLWTPDVEELLVATCANESDFGVFRTQAPHGPGRGIFQMEAEDFNDIWKNYLQYHDLLAFKIKALNGGVQGTADDLINKNSYAVAMCRVHYLRKPGAIPPANDIEKIWSYYKFNYNSIEGAATHDEFISKYNRYVLGKT